MVNYILVDNIYPFFTICLRELTSKTINGGSEPWKEGLSIWKTVCEKSTDKKVLTERLIADVSRINCAVGNTKEMFDMLIAAYKKEGKEAELIQVIVNNIEMLQQTGNGPNELFKIIDPAFFNKVIHQLQPDSEIYAGRKVPDADWESRSE